MYSLLGRLWGGTSCQQTIDEDEIRDQLPDLGDEEVKVLYGMVTEEGEEVCLVDGEFPLSVRCRAGGRRARMGDQVCVKLVREGEHCQWKVRDLLQVFREEWGGESVVFNRGEGGDTSALTQTKVRGTVKGSIRRGEVVVCVGSGKELRFCLPGIWGETFPPEKGDLVEVSLGLASDHLDDLEGCQIARAEPARRLTCDGLVDSWGWSGGTVSGQVYVGPGTQGLGCRPRRGDLVAVTAVECLASPGTLHCAWRAYHCTPRTGEFKGAGGRNQGWLVRGQARRQRALPSFVPLKLKEYPVPDFLESDTSCLADQCPELVEPLDPDNYRTKLSCLVQLESVAAQQELDMFSMQGAVLGRTGPYLSLEVPGLSEGKPSLVVGDSVRLSQAGSDQYSPLYEGCIHEVRGNQLLLRFDEQFELTYSGEAWDVAFIMSRTRIRRQLQALELARDQLGMSLLFPSQVVTKSPQVELLEETCGTEKVRSGVTKGDPNMRKVGVGTRDKPPFRKLTPSPEEANNNSSYDTTLSCPDVLSSGDCDSPQYHLSQETNPPTESDDPPHGSQKRETTSPGSCGDFTPRSSIKSDSAPTDCKDADSTSRGSEAPLPHSQQSEPNVPASQSRDLTPPHPFVRTPSPRQKTWSPRSSDHLRRKVLCSSLPATKLTTSHVATSSVWSVPTLSSLTTSTPSSLLLTALPNSFSLPVTSTPSYPPPYFVPPPTTSQVTWVTTYLNPEQKSAVRRIVGGEARPLPYVIFGPPGTGKTVTLVETILQLFLLRSDSRLLVAAPSNSSADLICDRLFRSGKVSFGDLARLNAFQRNPDLVPATIRPFCFVPSDQEELETVSRTRIVVTTCSTAGSLYRLGLRHGHFTHVLVDEAGHVTEPETLVPLGLLHTETQAQVVLAGDPKQLGPVLRSRTASMYGLGLSLLERLVSLPLYSRNDARFGDHGGYDPLLLTKLVRNYRSHPDILAVPNCLFYEGELVACATSSVQNRFLGRRLGMLLPNPQHPLVFHGVEGENLKEEGSPSWYNPQEVWQVGLYVQQLLEEGVEGAEVGVIAPYRQQVVKVREMLRTLGICEEGVTVGSVEEFQGQERPVIILSTVRTGIGSMDLQHSLGFLACEKRLNVAVTRAQSLLVVVGDPHVLVGDPAWRSLLSQYKEWGCFTGCQMPDLENPS